MYCIVRDAFVYVGIVYVLPYYVHLKTSTSAYVLVRSETLDSLCMTSIVDKMQDVPEQHAVRMQTI